MKSETDAKGGIDRALIVFEKLFMIVAMTSIFIMMISISADAISRYLFGSPITGQYEFTQFYLLVILVFMALPHTYMLDGHIRLRLLDRFLRRIPFDLSERLNATLGALVFGILSYVTLIEAVEKFVNQDKLFGAIQFPIYWSYVWVPLGSIFIALRLVLEIFRPKQQKAQAGGEV